MSAEPGQTTAELLFIGTATTLIRCGGFTLLTDPNFLHRGQRAHLGHGLWSKRLTDPALAVHELPPLDAVVLSHLHGDHFDRVAKAGLVKDVPLLTTRHAARRLRPRGWDAQALDTWQSTSLDKAGTRLTVTSMPGRHGPGPAQALLPPVMGSLLEFSTPGAAPLRIYVSGDTLRYPGLDEIPRRHPDLDVAVLHLGGTKVLGITVTMDARQGADVLELLRPGAAVPIHNDDYGVFKSPVSAFRSEVERRGLATPIRYVDRGDRVTLPPV